MFYLFDFFFLHDWCKVWHFHSIKTGKKNLSSYLLFLKSAPSGWQWPSCAARHSLHGGLGSLCQGREGCLSPFNSGREGGSPVSPLGWGQVLPGGWEQTVGGLGPALPEGPMEAQKLPGLDTSGLQHGARGSEVLPPIPPSIRVF